MALEDKTISLYIKNKDETSKFVTAEVLGNYFHNIQSMLYHMVEEIEGTKARRGGDFPSRIKNEYKLVIKDIKMGSADVQLVIFGGQSTLSPTALTIGEKAIDKMSDVIAKVQADDDLDEQLELIIRDSVRRRKIIELLDGVWPDTDSDYIVQLGLGKKEQKTLNPDYKKYIKHEMEKPEESYNKAYIGRLTRVSVDKTRNLQINSTEGIINCTYNPLIERAISENILGKLVKVRGLVTVDKKGKTLHIENVSDVERIDYIPLKVVYIKENPMVFKKPLPLTVEYEDDEYIVSNDELNIFSVSDNLDEAIEDLQKTIETLWKEYVDADMKTLSEESIAFRNKLKSMFKE